LRVEGREFWVWSLRFSVRGSGFRVQGLGLGFSVEGKGLGFGFSV